VLARYRSGRQVDALRAYQDARSALIDLGVEPGARLCDLEQLVIAQDPSLEWRPPQDAASDSTSVAIPAEEATSPAAPTTPEPAPTGSPLVGRDDALATFD